MKNTINLDTGNFVRRCKLNAVDVTTGKSIDIRTLHLNNPTSDENPIVLQLNVVDPVAPLISIPYYGIKAIEIETDEQSLYEPALRRHLEL